MSKAHLAALALAYFLFMPDPSACADVIRTANLEVNSGLRQERLRWDTIISELDWDNLDIYEIGGEARLVVGNERAPFAACLRVRGAYGEIYDGDVRDSDYTGQLEYSRSISDSDDGNTLELSAGIGPQFMFWDERVSIAALVGYNYREQNLTLTNGLQVVGSYLITPAAGTRIPELDSSYDASWEGAWIGMEASVHLSPRFRIKAAVEIQDINYEAEADWNLREDLAHPVSFEHAADGTCFTTSVALEYPLNHNWGLKAHISYGYMVAEDGTHTVYGSDGSATNIHLSEVEWESLGAGFGLRWNF